MPWRTWPKDSEMPKDIAAELAEAKANARKHEEDERYWGTWLCWRINGICECGKTQRKPICDKWKLAGEDLCYRITHKTMIPFMLALMIIDEVL